MILNIEVDVDFALLFYISVRENLKDLTKQYDKSENDLKALQSVGQIVGEVLKQLTEEKCKYTYTCMFNPFTTRIELWVLSIFRLPALGAKGYLPFFKNE